MIWGLLSSKIQFFNEKEEKMLSHLVHTFKVLIIFSNLNSASIREGSLISVKEVWRKKKSIQILHKNLKYILRYEIPHSLFPRAHNERAYINFKISFFISKAICKKTHFKRQIVKY